MSTANSNSGFGCQRRRLGVVSFLNSQPLVAGLDQRDDLELLYAVPAKLGALLDTGVVDAALVPVVDFARAAGAWRIVSDACIGSRGRTLTVRVAATGPLDQVTELHADPDSHTSVALAKVIWQRQWGITLQIRPLDLDRISEASAVLLIGDKVVRCDLSRFVYDLDLGQAWVQLTGLPFVFAIWAQRRGDNIGGLGNILEAARDRGVAEAAALARRQAARHGWPEDLAVEYLTRCLSFELTPDHRRGLERFFELSGQSGLIPTDGRVVRA